MQSVPLSGTIIRRSAINSINGAGFFVSQSDLLAWWGGAVVLIAFLCVCVATVPRPLERARKFLPALLLAPGLVVAVLLLTQGFEVIERPIVHWIFDKRLGEALRIGIQFDPVSFAVTFFFGLVITLIGVKNRPAVRISAAMALSWSALAVVATASTLWMACLGMGLQLFARFLPILPREDGSAEEDLRWTATTKRSWYALAAILCGGVGLAVGGIGLDFGMVADWRGISITSAAGLGAGLLLAGLVLLASPFFSSHATDPSAEGSAEEDSFISETALSWSAVLVAYRLLGSSGESPWTLAISIAALCSLFLSSVAIVFQDQRRSAVRFWLASIPAYLLSVLPSLSAYESRVYLIGAVLAFAGLWMSLEHRGRAVDKALAGFFLAGLFGLAGWSTSTGVTFLYSSIESDAVWGASVFIVSLLFCMVGARLVFAGSTGAPYPYPALKYGLLALIIISGFGPLLTGRWGGGSVPFQPDWVSGATTWPWVSAIPGQAAATNWLGFSLAQAVWVFGMALGATALHGASLYPWSSKHPRMGESIRGLFGLIRLQRFLGAGVRTVGEVGSEKISNWVWERFFPDLGHVLLRIGRSVGAQFERLSDPLTGSGYAEIFRAPAKLVQWLHGGNVRLYLWFALVWILIFSVYLTR